MTKRDPSVNASDKFYEELAGRTPHHRLENGAGADRATPELEELRRLLASRNVPDGQSPASMGVGIHTRRRKRIG